MRYRVLQYGHQHTQEERKKTERGVLRRGHSSWVGNELHRKQKDVSTRQNRQQYNEVASAWASIFFGEIIDDTSISTVFLGIIVRSASRRIMWVLTMYLRYALLYCLGHGWFGALGSYAVHTLHRQWVYHTNMEYDTSYCGRCALRVCKSGISLCVYVFICRVSTLSKSFVRIVFFVFSLLSAAFLYSAVGLFFNVTRTIGFIWRVGGIQWQANYKQFYHCLKICMCHAMRVFYSVLCWSKLKKRKKGSKTLEPDGWPGVLHGQQRYHNVTRASRCEVLVGV